MDQALALKIKHAVISDSLDDITTYELRVTADGEVHVDRRGRYPEAQPGKIAEWQYAPYGGVVVTWRTK